MSRRAVFLDRDGTLVRDVGYLSRVADVAVLPGVREALARLRAAGFALVVVTNQSGIGRGYFGEAEYREVDRAIRAALGTPLDGIYHCPHGPDDGCACRKPAPGMLLQAAAELGLDLSASWMIGDGERDAAAGLAAGCRAIVVGPAPAPAGALHAADLPAAAALVLAARAE